jgi:hypothetical protein
MAWDTELEKLTNFVAEHFGVGTFDAALHRATAGVMLRAQTTEGSADLILSSEALTNRYYEALRTELRRLVRPH